MIRITVYFCDICLAGAGGEQQRSTDQNEENSGFFQCKHWRLLDVVFIRESSGERWT